MKRPEQRCRKFVIDYIKDKESGFSYDLGKYIVRPSTDMTFLSIFDNTGYIFKPKLLFSIDLETSVIFGDRGEKRHYMILKNVVQEIKEL